MFRIFDHIIQEIDKLISDQVRNVRTQRLEKGYSSSSAVKVCDPEHEPYVLKKVDLK